MWGPVPPPRHPRPLLAVPLESAIPAPTQSGSGAVTRRLALVVATALGVGLAPVAPGTFGSALAIPIFVLFSPLPWGLLLLSWAALLALGIWASDQSEAAFGRKDDGRIVIDEVVGQLLTLAPLCWPGVQASPAAVVTGFVLFRCFDIWKPLPVRWAEQALPGGLGVMMDDVVAGALGALALAGLLAAGVFGALG